MRVEEAGRGPPLPFSFKLNDEGDRSLVKHLGRLGSSQADAVTAPTLRAHRPRRPTPHGRQWFRGPPRAPKSAMAQQDERRQHTSPSDYVRTCNSKGSSAGALAPRGGGHRTMLREPAKPLAHGRSALKPGAGMAWIEASVDLSPCGQFDVGSRQRPISGAGRASKVGGSTRVCSGYGNVTVCSVEGATVSQHRTPVPTTAQAMNWPRSRRITPLRPAIGRPGEAPRSPPQHLTLPAVDDGEERAAETAHV